jgi:hypothetical protein
MRCKPKGATMLRRALRILRRVTPLALAWGCTDEPERTRQALIERTAQLETELAATRNIVGSLTGVMILLACALAVSLAIHLCAKGRRHDPPRNGTASPV